MQRDSQGTPTTRRSFLGTLGLTLAGLGLTGQSAADDTWFVLEQGDRCVPVTPLSGDVAVEELYDWDTDESDYSAAGLTDLQRPETSIVFLYDGPNGLSLVLVHDEYGDETDGGSATFEITGLPLDGEWVVRDDYYDAESNYDRWNTENGTAIIDWTWGASRTDGGVYRGLADQPDLEITVTPAFNDAAALDGEHYDGEITAWELLTGSMDDPDRTSLALNEPIVLRRGACSTDGTTGGSDGGDQQDDSDEQDGDETDDGDDQQDSEDDQTDDEESDDEQDSEDEEETEEDDDEKKEDEEEEDSDEADEEDEDDKDEDEEDDDGDEEDDDDDDDDDEDDDDHPGKGKDDDHPGKGKGKDGDHPGKGHENDDHPGKGKGHKKGRGKGHGKHGDDND